MVCVPIFQSEVPLFSDKLYPSTWYLLKGQAVGELDFDRAILLLGAGASVKAGVPHAFGFIEAIRRHLKTLEPSASRALRVEYWRTRKVLRAWEPGRIGLEPLYEAIDDCLDAHYLGRKSPNPLEASRALERLHYEIKRCIQIQCNVRGRSRVEYLIPLISRLGLSRLFPIVSFNYDSVVETACSTIGKVLTDPMLDPIRRTGIELIKVHGSVTWFADRRATLERSGNPVDVIVRRLGELRSPTLETPMIYPSRHKMPLYGPFMRNSLRAQELLHDPERTACIAVGYSFPDLHVRSWLTEAMKVRTELQLYLVDPSPGAAIRNLTTGSPTVRWSDRLWIVDKPFEKAIEEGFEASLAAAKRFGPAYRDASNPALASYPKCFDGPASGLGASPDGTTLYISESGDAGRVFKIDLQFGHPALPIVFASGLKDPRGIAVAPDGDIFVVQNRLFKPRFLPGRGGGSVVRFSAEGRRKTSPTKLKVGELRPLLNALRKKRRAADLWGQLQSILRWPTDIIAAPNGRVFVTEARALSEIGGPNRGLERICRPELVFNLHGLDSTDDGNLVAVEQGIGQDSSWGRVLRFDFAPGGVRSISSAAAEGRSRLMGICFVPTKRKVVVTQALTWPLGGLLILDYPALDNPHFLGEFDFPQKVAYVPVNEALAVSGPDGVRLLPLDILNHAIPIAG